LTDAGLTTNPDLANFARDVLENMSEAFFLLDREFRLLDVNRYALSLDGRPKEELVGRTLWELTPGLEDSGLGQLFKWVMLHRQERTATHHQEWEDGHSAWLESRIVPVGAGVAAFYRDVSAELSAQEELRGSEALQRFLLELGDRTREVADPKAIIAITARALGERLKASRVLYTDIDDAAGRAAILPNWTAEGVGSLPPELSLTEVGAPIVARLRQGETLCVDDTITHADTADSVAFLDAIKVRALISVPLLKDGCLVANLNVHKSEPHRWKADELQLVQTVAERTWEAMQRAVTEAELRASEGRLQLAKQAAGFGVWDWDLRTDVISWSPEMFELLGIDPATSAERLYESWLPAIHTDDRAQADAVVRASASTGDAFSIDFRVVRPDGEIRWVRSQATGEVDEHGRPVRLTGINVDITAQRRQEEGLRERAEALEQRISEALAERQVLADFVDSTNTAVLGCDLGFGIIAINTATATQMERIYGVRPKVGDNLLQVLASMPEHRAQVEQHWGRAMSGEEFSILEEFGDPGRERAYYEVRFHPMLDRDGRQIGAFQAAHDVTERVRAAKELEAAQEALRQSQKMEAMGQLTGGVAHDFNNLLTPIVGSLDLLQRRGLGGEREQRLIAGAAQSAERAKTLVQRLLAFARRQPLQPVPVDIAKLVRGMGDLISSTTGPQIEVAVQTGEDLPAAKADPNQLEMALLNLSVNARDAMPHGGTLRISATAERVDGRHPALKPGSYVKLSVADTGSGMDEATLARAIEPFFSTKGVGKGTGLGLSMVHGLASQLGGALTIQSQPGLGTNVELWLPQSSDAPKDIETSVQVSNDISPCGTALLVDDEELVRLSTADMLIDLGYGVVEAASAKEAMLLVNEGKQFDLLVTDHLMPGMTGTDLARAFRARRPDLPVLLVSGYAEGEGIDADLPRLTKPFRKDELASSLSQLRAVERTISKR
jgi:PAS domain S-box-containing protein